MCSSALRRNEVNWLELNVFKEDLLIPREELGHEKTHVYKRMVEMQFYANGYVLFENV